MEKLKKRNQLLLCNILPTHVAEHFLNAHKRHDVNKSIMLVISDNQISRKLCLFNYTDMSNSLK